MPKAKTFGAKPIEKVTVRLQHTINGRVEQTVTFVIVTDDIDAVIGVVDSALTGAYGSGEVDGEDEAEPEPEPVKTPVRKRRVRS